MAGTTTDSADFHVGASPDAGIFAGIDNSGRSAGDLLTLLFTMPGCPPGREDLKGQRMPTAEEIAASIAGAEEKLELRARTNPEARALIAASFSGGAEARRQALCVMLYTMEMKPIPVYQWLNAWLDSGDLWASDTVAKHIGPFFAEYTKAVEKLPRMTAAATRAVCNIAKSAQLRYAFDNYKTHFAQKQPVNFWCVASFTTDDAVVGKKEFCGLPHEDAIVFRCQNLTGASLALLSAVPQAAEIQPPTPASFVVVDAYLVQRKLHVFLEQQSVPQTGCYPAIGEMADRQFFLKIMELEPTNGAAFRSLAFSLSASETVAVPGMGGMTKQQLFLKAIELDPTDGAAFYGLALTLSPSETVTMPVPGMGDFP